jgi:hypothetical protein
LSGLLLLLLICRVVHRSLAAAVSGDITYSDSRNGSRGRGRGGTRYVRRCKNIVIEDDVGDFKGKLVTYLELEAMRTVGRNRLLLLRLLWRLWLLLLLLLL